MQVIFWQLPPGIQFQQRFYLFHYQYAPCFKSEYCSLNNALFGQSQKFAWNMLENNIFFFDSTCMHEKNPVKWGDFGNSTVTLGGTELLQNKHYKYNLPVFVYSFLVALLSIALLKRWLLLGSSGRGLFWILACILYRHLRNNHFQEIADFYKNLV